MIGLRRICRGFDILSAERDLSLHGRKGHRLPPAVRARTCSRRDADNLCRINPVKPDKCRTFPQSWVNPGADRRSRAGLHSDIRLPSRGAVADSMALLRLDRERRVHHRAFLLSCLACACVCGASGIGGQGEGGRREVHRTSHVARRLRSRRAPDRHARPSDALANRHAAKARGQVLLPHALRRVDCG